PPATPPLFPYTTLFRSRANVAKQADVERLFSETKKAFGRLDILVNNAGVYEFSPIEGVTEEHFHKHFDLNVLGLLLASKEAARQDRKSTRLNSSHVAIS